MTDKLLNGANGAAPSYMAGVGDTEDFGGGMDGNSYPRLAFKGSRFRLRQGDEEIVLEQTTLEVIILKDYPHISRIFFAEGYDNDEGGGRPSCASADGEVPVPTIAAPQHSLCATCPQNEKGSSITDDGKKSRACSFYKRIILLIKGYEDVGPVVADIKAMSLFGDSKSGDNWWTLKAYFGRLKANKVMPFHLYTKLTFDTDLSVPKVLFQPVGYVDESMFVDTVTPLVATPDGTLLLEQMADTGTVRVEGEEDGEPSLGLGADKPAHLGGPAAPAAGLPAPAKPETVSKDVDLAVSLAGDLAKAIAAEDFGTAAEIQKQIKALEEAPQPEADKKQVDVQGTVDAYKVDMKIAVDAGDYARAAEIQEEMVNFIEANKAKPAAAVKKAQAKVDEENLTPQQKAARTRARNKKLKEEKEAATKKAAEEAASAEQPDPAPAGDDPSAFGDELEGALKDFGF